MCDWVFFLLFNIVVTREHRGHGRVFSAVKAAVIADAISFISSGSILVGAARANGLTGVVICRGLKENATIITILLKQCFRMVAWDA